MGTFDTQPEMPEHSPPQFLVIFGDDVVSCSAAEVKEAITQMTEAHPGEFIDIYELRTCARLPLVQPLPEPKIILPGASNDG